MKNVLQYYYKLNPERIHQINKDYRCTVNNQLYLLHRIEEYGNELYDLYNLGNVIFQKGIPCYKIIPNFNNDLVTIVNNEHYILLEIFEIVGKIEFDDIKVFSNVHIDVEQYKELNRSEWYKLWTNKIDYIEYQASQFGKSYPIIRSSINYYVGLAETAISLLPKNKSFYYLTVAHKRVKSKNKITEFYNPLNFILDVRIRDLSEFYKENFFEKGIDWEDLKKHINSYKMSSQEALLFYARMLFPTYYFDCYQSVMLGEIEEKEVLKYINKVEKYQQFLKELFFFLKQYYNIPEIEWIIKT